MNTPSRLSAAAPTRRAGMRGFTLAEMLLCTGVMAVLTAISLPALGSWVRQRAVEAEVAEFQAALRQARLTSVHRGARVTLCARAQGGAEVAPRCKEEGEDWSHGWLVFVDHGEPGQVDAGDRVIAEHQPGQRAGRLEASLRYLSFHPIGVATNAASHFRFVPAGAAADVAHPEGSQLVCVNKPGRGRVTGRSQCA